MSTPSAPTAPAADRPNNAIRHGLTARQVVLPTESAEAWQAFEQAYVEELQPVGVVEETLAHRAAEPSYLWLRATEAQSPE